MQFDNAIMELAVRHPSIRQLVLDMDREQQARLTHLRVLDPFGDLRYTSSDAGNGYLFADLYGDRARYVTDRGCWYVYRDGVWTQDHGQARAMELARQLVRMMHVLCYAVEDEAAAQEALRRVQRMYSLPVRHKMLRDAGSVYPLMAADFDTDPWLFNCQNGTLDLRTGEFRAHRSSDLIARMADVRYDPEAKCPRWDAFIQEIMAVPGQEQAQLRMEGAAPDPAREKAAYLQRAAGYALTGSTKHECFFLLHGQTTRNGKGTLMETLVRMMGTYARVARPETLSARFTSGSGPSEDLARLHGARLVSISEPDRRITLSAGVLKQMTGNDTITARFLNEGSFQFRPQFKLFINTNHLPRADDMTLFHSERVRILPFDRHFAPGEQDQDLKTFFAQAENLSAVLNWCLAGVRAWQAQGLNEPEAVNRATERYRRESDLVGQFCEACLQQAPGSRVRTADVYQRYRAWCEQMGEKPETNHLFWKMMNKGKLVKRARVTGQPNPVSVLMDHCLV